MPLSNLAVFTQGPRTAMAVVTTATPNPATASSSTLVKLCDAGSQGSEVEYIGAIPQGTLSAALQLLLYVSKDNGSTVRLIDSEVITQYTLSATTAIPSQQFLKVSRETPRTLAPGDSLWVGIATAQNPGIVYNAIIRDY